MTTAVLGADRQRIRAASAVHHAMLTSSVSAFINAGKNPPMQVRYI
jgi:hypothetical protein